MKDKNWEYEVYGKEISCIFPRFTCPAHVLNISCHIKDNSIVPSWVIPREDSAYQFEFYFRIKKNGLIGWVWELFESRSSGEFDLFDDIEPLFFIKDELRDYINWINWSRVIGI